MTYLTYFICEQLGLQLDNLRNIVPATLAFRGPRSVIILQTKINSVGTQTTATKVVLLMGRSGCFVSVFNDRPGSLKGYAHLAMAWDIQMRMVSFQVKARVKERKGFRLTKWRKS